MFEDGGIERGEFDVRVRRCLSEMEKKNVDLMYVYGDSTAPGNLTYLTNYRPAASDLPGTLKFHSVFLLSRDGSATLILDRDYYLDWVKEESWVEDIVADDEGDILRFSFEMVRKRGLDQGRIEVDTKYMSSGFYRQFMKTFGAAEIDEGSRIVAGLREEKSDKEVELISRGLEIIGKAQEAALMMSKQGVREFEIAHEIRAIAMNEGADYVSALFVDAGRRSTIPLANPMSTAYRLKDGDMVLVSIFVSYKKYVSGMDRNWVVGEPSENQRVLAEIEGKGLEEAIRLSKPGFKVADYPRRVYQDFMIPLLKDAGIENYNLAGYLGHGCGYHLLEAPVLWQHDDSVLKPGMVIHIEPGLYSKDPAVGGMRTADTIVITEEGNINVTGYPRRIGSLQ